MYFNACSFYLNYRDPCDSYVPAGALPLPWSIRMKIALGTAKGLPFLHEEAERPVIYRDFKTSNILLDVVGNPCLISTLKTYYSRTTMLSFLTLDLPKMVQKEIRHMYLPV